jgi:hypothetical protein
LTPTEIAAFAAGDVRAESVEQLADDAGGLSRWRAEFRR